MQRRKPADRRHARTIGVGLRRAQRPRARVVRTRQRSRSRARDRVDVAERTRDAVARAVHPDRAPRTRDRRVRNLRTIERPACPFAIDRAGQGRADVEHINPGATFEHRRARRRHVERVDVRAALQRAYS